LVAAGGGVADRLQPAATARDAAKTTIQERIG